MHNTSTTNARTRTRQVLGSIFILAGIAHFWKPKLYARAMPGYLPWHPQLIALSGLAEIVLGALVLVPRWARVAGWGLMALLVAVFPANVHMALHPRRYRPVPGWMLWARLPLQPALIALVRWCTR